VIGARRRTFEHACGAQDFTQTEHECMTTDPKKHPVDTLADARESRFTVLHKRTPLPHGKRQDDGLSEAFVASLDRSQLRVVRPGDLPTSLSLVDAWARLRTEDRRLAAAVAATVIQGQTVREAAPALGVSFKTVATRKSAGIADLAIWTGMQPDMVESQLQTFALLHSA